MPGGQLLDTQHAPFLMQWGIGDEKRLLPSYGQRINNMQGAYDLAGCGPNRSGDSPHIHEIHSACSSLAYAWDLTESLITLKPSTSGVHCIFFQSSLSVFSTKHEIRATYQAGNLSPFVVDYADCQPESKKCSLWDLSQT